MSKLIIPAVLLVVFLVTATTIMTASAEPDDEQVQKICAKEKNPHCKDSGVGTDGKSVSRNDNVNTDATIPIW
jgi:hypothetical protein